MNCYTGQLDTRPKALRKVGEHGNLPKPRPVELAQKELEQPPNHMTMCTRCVLFFLFSACLNNACEAFDCLDVQIGGKAAGRLIARCRFRRMWDDSCWGLLMPALYPCLYIAS
jgi:hypothetical protein